MQKTDIIFHVNNEAENKFARNRVDIILVTPLAELKIPI